MRALGSAGLSELRIGKCGVGDAAASELCDASPSLTAIDLHSNQVR